MEQHIGDRLREIRAQANLSQSKLGKLVDREQQEIFHWEKHGRILASELPALAKALHVPLVAFYTNEELNSKEQGPIDWPLQLATAELSPQARAALSAFLRIVAMDAHPSTPDGDDHGGDHE